MHEINWEDMIGNPYRYGLQPQMMMAEGSRYSTLAKIRGQSRLEEKKPVIIRFNETYVINYIQKQVIEKLKPASYDEFKKIIDKAWAEYQANGQ